LEVDTSVSAEYAASISSTEVIRMRMWPGYIHNTKRNMVTKNRGRGRGVRARMGKEEHLNAFYALSSIHFATGLFSRSPK
jgi:hypothetical protein